LDCGGSQPGTIQLAALEEQGGQAQTQSGEEVPQAQPMSFGWSWPPPPLAGKYQRPVGQWNWPGGPKSKKAKSKIKQAKKARKRNR
jgi:hypothetical protein